MLSETALLTVPEVRSVLGFVDSSRDAQIELLIDEATAMVESTYCQRPIKSRWVTNLRMEGPLVTRELYPDVWPINTAGIITVSVNGTAQTVWRSEADGDPELFDVMAFTDHFYRAEGWAPTGTIRRNVVLSYLGGYDPVPNDLKEATLELIAKMWGPRMGQTFDVGSLSGPGGSYTTLDGQWAGGVSTAPWSLTRRSKEIFEAHRTGRCRVN